MASFTIMRIVYFLSYAFMIKFVSASTFHHLRDSNQSAPEWIVHAPLPFREGKYRGNQMIDSRNSLLMPKLTEIYYQTALQDAHGATDGESVDIIDHFFWGHVGGIALELGSLDGTPMTHSMTYWMEHLLDWKRILVEANPRHKKNMKQENNNAFSVNAAICNNSSQLLHYAVTQPVVTSGILEFMNPNFLQRFHRKIYEACNPKGDLSSIKDWKIFKDVSLIHCLPLSLVFREAGVNYINLFILDVEGAELQILESIDWSQVQFDVICVETEAALRPANYPALVESFLANKGYKNCCGQIGRNSWFIREGFEPSRKPGLKPGCFRGEIASHAKNQVSAEEFAKKLNECLVKKV
eukprot:gene8934-9673_t